MALSLKPMHREFLLDGRKVADPDPNLSIDEVRSFLSGTYAELNNASYDEEVHGATRRITFRTAVGTKG